MNAGGAAASVSNSGSSPSLRSSGITSLAKRRMLACASVKRHAPELECIDAGAALRLFVDMFDAVVALLRRAIDLEFNEKVSQAICTLPKK